MHDMRVRIGVLCRGYRFVHADNPCTFVQVSPETRPVLNHAAFYICGVRQAGVAGEPLKVVRRTTLFVVFPVGLRLGLERGSRLEISLGTQRGITPNQRGRHGRAFPDAEGQSSRRLSARG